MFEDGTFRPAAKITANGTYSIITDHLGTPVEMYDAHGERLWAAELDIYGDIRGIYLRGKRADCPFRYPGQYEDVETGLYYNRFQYQYLPMEILPPGIHLFLFSPNTSTSVFGSPTYPYNVGLFPASPIGSCCVYIPSCGK